MFVLNSKNDIYKVMQPINQIYPFVILKSVRLMIRKRSILFHKYLFNLDKLIFDNDHRTTNSQIPQKG